MRTLPSHARLQRHHRLANQAVAVAVAGSFELVSGRSWDAYAPTNSSFGFAFRGAGVTRVTQITSPRLDFGDRSLTVAALVRRASAVTTPICAIGCGVADASGPTSNGIALRVESGGARLLYGSGNSRVVSGIVGATTTNTDWHTVVGFADREAGRIGIYIDGVLAGDQALSVSGSADTTDPLKLGAYGGGTDFTPLNGDVAIAIVATRRWDLGDVQLFQQDPFAVIRPRQRSYFAFAGAAPTPSIIPRIHHHRQMMGA